GPPRSMRSGVSEPQPSYSDEAPRKSRTTAIAAAACVLLALPFLVLGPYLLNAKARVELRCQPGGVCLLFHSSWLTRDEVASFAMKDVQGVKVDRTRAARRNRVPIFRPTLVTAHGEYPLFFQWVTEEAVATRVEARLEQAFANPGDAPLEFVWDDRDASLRVGGAFTSVGVLLLVFAAWLGSRTRTHLRAEQASA
ncbi:hypothetical protein, partial [Myxococcus sp. AM010]|uniref:hypothetical protein n=1 Tax=Myxococcus sp. AM010 TaxID=2745138 RepID=UPI0020D0E854